MYAQFIQCSLALYYTMISESPQINSKESPSLLLIYIYKESVQLKKLEV